MDTVVLIIQLLTPFFVIFLTVYLNRKEKTRETNAAKEEERKSAEQKEINEKLESMGGEIQRLTETLERYHSENETITKSLQHITGLNRTNGRYTHELAQLVMVLAEGLRDQHLDGNITKAISKYRKFETNTLGSYVIGDTNMLDQTKSDDLIEY